MQVISAYKIQNLFEFLTPHSEMVDKGGHSHDFTLLPSKLQHELFKNCLSVCLPVRLSICLCLPLSFCVLCPAHDSHHVVYPNDVLMIHNLINIQYILIGDKNSICIIG